MLSTKPGTSSDRFALHRDPHPARAASFADDVRAGLSARPMRLSRGWCARGCSSTFVLEDGEVDGEDGALSFLLTAQSAGLRVIGVQAFQRRAPGYTPLARGVAGSGADCVLISAIDEASAASLTEHVAQALPRATIFATGALAAVETELARELANSEPHPLERAALQRQPRR